MKTLVGHEYLWSCGAEREVEILSRSGKKCTTGLAYWCSWAAWAPTEQPRLNLNHAPWFRSKDRSTFWFPHVDHTVDGQRKYRVVYLPLALCPLPSALYIEQATLLCAWNVQITYEHHIKFEWWLIDLNRSRELQATAISRT